MDDCLARASELILLAVEQNQEALQLSSRQVQAFKRTLHTAERKLRAERYVSKFLEGQSEALEELMDSISEGKGIRTPSLRPYRP
jgi:hypothetical protein